MRKNNIEYNTQLPVQKYNLFFQKLREEIACFKFFKIRLFFFLEQFENK